MSSFILTQRSTCITICHDCTRQIHKSRPGHRVGYIGPGYDADPGIWYSHPHRIGTTLVEIYIECRSTANNAIFLTGNQNIKASPIASQIKKKLIAMEQDGLCKSIRKIPRLILAGITKSLAEAAVIKSIDSGEQ